MNGLPVFGADIQNAYLQAPTTEKHYIICGPEFGLENEGKKAIIVRALYGGKSVGADYWCPHVRKAMHEMGFSSCKADPEVWMRPRIKDDGSEYWQYVLLYTDDILCVMEHPEKFLREEMGTRFTLKEIGPPTQYLGNKVSNVTLENGTSCWSFSSSQYVQSAFKNVEDQLAKTGEKLPTRVRSPCWPCNYRPESDLSPELSSDKATYFQFLIGVLRWIVELGRADIAMEKSALASMMASPRAGHLNAVYHMFAFLKIKHNGVMVFDPPTEPDLDTSQFPVEDWSASAYGEQCKEEIPPNAPKSRGLGFIMRAFVDSDHAGDTITRRSSTGFLIFLNSAPIYWYSKKQGSVE